MVVRQMLVGNMAVFCYMIQDIATNTCALIDPAFETQKILAQVREAGCTVTHLINTHGHSDHTCGNATIIKETGARLYIHKADAKKLGSLISKGVTRVLGGGPSPAADVLLTDGRKIEIGETSLEVIHTPGHTPGGICLYGGGNLFTGDSLFVGAVGRTDLPGGSSRQLVDSIRQRLYTLPDDTKVYPGHHYGDNPVSTIGEQKTTNPFTM